MGRPLYELASDYRALQERLDEGAVADDLQLDALSGAMEDKALAIMHVMRQLDLEAEVLKQEEQRLAARRRAAEANKERLRSYVARCMAEAGVHKIKGPTLTLSLRETAERVVVVDEALVPETYVRVKREVNKAAVLDAYKETGEIVPGCSIERGTALYTR